MRADLPPGSAYPWYLAGSSLWMAGMSLYGFLFTWLLVGVLEEPADRAGFARSLAELPPLAILLLGGLLGDRRDARSVLLVTHLTMCLPPLAIAAIFELGAGTYAWVVIYGILMASIQALSDPSRQAALSRVTRFDVQRSITIMTICTSLVGTAAFYLGGQLETLGLTLVLALQAAMFALSAATVERLPRMPPVSTIRPDFRTGLRAVWQHTLIRNIVGLNLTSSLFNAGAYIIAIPYIVTQVYAGDAAFFAQVMIVFTIGSVGSNVLLLVFMPLVHPGRLFLALQLTRVAILAVIWTEPNVWLFQIAIFAWGLNMGVTTTMVRTTVQELAPAGVRSQILSVLLLSFIVSSPISASLLGLLISASTPTTALLPGIVISLAIFVIGVWRSGLWQYRYAPADIGR